MTIETELKLLLAQEDMPRLRRHPALRILRRGRVSTRLIRSVYYDTPAFDLNRVGYVLRLRSDGGRWVQTLKSEGSAAGGLFQREEWEWAVAGETLDLALLRDTPAQRLLRNPEFGALLKPAFSTEFSRSSIKLGFAEGTRAELCADCGAIRNGESSSPICEIEIELVEGNPVRLFDLALALAQDLKLRVGLASKAERGYALGGGAAARPSKAVAVPLRAGDNAVAALRRIAWACIGHALANQSGVLAGKDSEYLHQMRVALRRLRACLSAFKPLLQGNMVAPVAADLRELGMLLGEARDWDVFMTETLPALSSHGEEGRSLAALRRQCARRRGASLRKARHALESAHYQRLWLQLGRLLAGDAAFASEAARSAPLATFAAGLLERRARKLGQRGERVERLDQQQRHSLRIAVKKQRYAAEFFASLFSEKRARPYIAALQQLQELLGTLNDAASAAVLVSSATQGARGDELLARGLVLGWSAARSQLHGAELRRAWERFRRQKTFWKKNLDRNHVAVKETIHV